MQFLIGDITVKRIRHFVMCLATVLILVTSGCVTAPKLTPEDRKRDIQFLADWTRDYNPFVELNEKYKNTPSYEALLPRYLEFAEHAQTHEEFYQVVNGYFKVIGASGHFYPLDEEMLKWGKIASFLGIIKLGITPGQCDRARYWVRLSKKISTRAHPPFHVESREDRYFNGGDWPYEETTIPKGSEILKVNGMTCSRYLEHVKTNTSLKYDAFPKDWVNHYLMIVDEGSDFKGWQVDFKLPDGNMLAAFVPKVKGFPAPKEPKVWTKEPKENCTCLELTEDVGYIRIKACMSGYLSYLFRGYIKKDRNKIKDFLNHPDGKYTKLIIDIRNNGGGLPQYGYDALISPFLDEPVTYSQVVGVKTKYLTDTDKSVLQFLREEVSTQKAHVICVTEIKPPEEFDPNQWTFYEVTRKIEPRNRYNFKGDLYFLINGGCYSAADDILNAVKRIGLARLVGRNTGGGAAGYFAPPIITLPASGMAFRVETDVVINPDGSYDEISGTPPDIELPIADPPKSITKEDLLKDEWVRKIIDDL
ncbi:S41 family peptidase [Planctomycetota bacterium]